MNDDDIFQRLQLDPAVLAQPHVPTRVKKRRKYFAMLPMQWYEKLAKPVPACRCTCLVAWYLLYLNWKNEGKPFKLANGMLAYDGIGHDSKLRALRDLEQRGLVTVEWQDRKSPIVQAHT